MKLLLVEQILLLILGCKNKSVIPLKALNMGRQKTVILHLLVFSLRSPIQPHFANYNAIQYLIEQRFNLTTSFKH